MSDRDDWDEYRLSEELGYLEELGRRAVEAEFANLTAAATASDDMPTDGVPQVGYCHPALTHLQSTLANWLDGEMLGLGHLCLPVVVSRARWTADDGPPTAVAPRVTTVERRKVFRPAPYVGRPFGYTYWVGVDEMGRMCTGMVTTLQYTMSEAEALVRGLAEPPLQSGVLDNSGADL